MTHSFTLSSMPELVDPTALHALNRQTTRTYALMFVALGVATAIGGALVALVDPQVALPVLFVLVGAVTVALGMFVGKHSALVRPHQSRVRTFWIVLALTLVATVVALFAWPGHEWIGWLTAALGLGDGLATGHLIDHADDPARA